jgi:hypothetical protein
MIVNPYHLEVIQNIITHKHYENACVLYIVELVKRLFPDYRENSDLVQQIDQLCLKHGK